MIRKSGDRFSLATDAERVCAEIMLKKKVRAGLQVIPLGVGVRIKWGAQHASTEGLEAGRGKQR
jgi:hypothetical protein